jgi:hypothetical protein
VNAKAMLVGICVMLFAPIIALGTGETMLIVLASAPAAIVMAGAGALGLLNAHEAQQAAAAQRAAAERAAVREAERRAAAEREAERLEWERIRSYVVACTPSRSAMLTAATAEQEATENDDAFRQQIAQRRAERQARREAREAALRQQAEPQPVTVEPQPVEQPAAIPVPDWPQPVEQPVEQPHRVLGIFANLEIRR